MEQLRGCGGKGCTTTPTVQELRVTRWNCHVTGWKFRGWKNLTHSTYHHRLLLLAGSSLEFREQPTRYSWELKEKSIHAEQKSLQWLSKFQMKRTLWPGRDQTSPYSKVVLALNSPYISCGPLPEPHSWVRQTQWYWWLCIFLTSCGCILLLWLRMVDDSR